ncbi:carbohydrate-binding module family 18 protein [Xylariaceae sp. FL1272]|nr:carbohydrate-binding module family 18 protein [Xylariaceae sp. FL1272]
MAPIISVFIIVSTFCCAVVATFNITSKNNIVVYYGQGPYQKRLTTYCADPSVDVIVLSFVHLFPGQANGFPGINFGNQCSGETYPGPGYNGKKDSSKDSLLKCPNIQQDLYTCRKSSTKKILLALGGGTPDYQLTGSQEGTAFATQIWGMFGPQSSEWIKAGLPRPFDYYDPVSKKTVAFSVDGFDLDIEHQSTDGSAGYVGLVTRLRALYQASKSTFYLTGSPQCVVPDANMATFVSAAQFDMLFVQFYNTQECSAARWVSENTNYQPGRAFDEAGFTFTKWVSWITQTKYSKGARVYIGLPGSSLAAAPGYSLSSNWTKNIVSAFYCNPNFGGLSIWEATYAGGNVEGGKNYYQNAKASLEAAGKDSRLPCGTRKRG